MAYTPPTPYAPLSGQVGYGSGLQLVDEVLSNVAKQFRPQGYLYDDICAPIPVQFRSGRYPVFDPSTFFAANAAMEVADDAPTPIVDFNWSHDVYKAITRRLQVRLTREEMLQANAALRLEYSKTIGLLTNFATNRELRLAAKLRTTANGGQFTNAGIAPSVKWDNGTSGSPATIQADIQNAALTAMKACGKRPNTLILDYEVALAISNDYTVKQQLQYRIGDLMLSHQLADSFAGNGNSGGVLPARLFGFNVLVADGTLYNNARLGQSPTLAGVWGTSARLVYIDPQAQWGIPATVYSFRAPVTGTSAQPPSTIMPSGDGGMEPGLSNDWAIVERWWDMDPAGEHIRVTETVDERVVAPELGVELTNVISSVDDSSEY